MCQYIRFGSANRCRNCGYDFSLSEDPAPLDLPIGTETEPIGPPADLPLRAPGPATDRASSAGASESAGAPRPARPPGRPDLPLFSRSDDAPLVTPPAVPRAPLSVRRAPPIITRPSVVEDELDSESEDLDDEAPASPRKSTSGVVGGIAS